MKTAVIYARYSSDNQRDRSLADQIKLCQDLARREELHVVEVFEDRAISGTKYDRPGFLRLMAAAKTKRFDVLIVEDQDRLTRDQGDFHAARKVLDFFGIRLLTASGFVGGIDGSVRALLNELYVENLAAHTKRGLAGVVADGRHAGGRSYGYAPVPGSPGVMQITENEAKVIREIYGAFVGGKTARQIAHDLNKRGVKPPRGKWWNASALNGSRDRHNGILQNEAYRGVLVWNRVSMRRDPVTRKRISRPNPRSEWKTAPVPHLRIVSDELFEAVQIRKAARRGDGSLKAARDARGPRHLLSGLLRCGSCGAGMCSVGASRKGGRARIICSAHRENGSCGNLRRVYLDSVEDKVIGGLRHHLAHPALINEFVKSYNEERKRLAKEASRERHALERRLGAIEREIANLVEALKVGGAAISAIVVSLQGLEAEKAKLAADLTTMNASDNVVVIHPKAVERYQRALAKLSDEVRRASPEEIAIIRSLIKTVTVCTETDGSVYVDIKGRIAALCDCGSVGGSGGATRTPDRNVHPRTTAHDHEHHLLLQLHPVPLTNFSSACLSVIHV
jgi:site-specific DNA recombinase